MQLATLMTFFSVLCPTRLWYSPNQPLTISVKTEQPVTLVLTEFSGRPVEAKGSAEIAASREVDLRRSSLRSRRAAPTSCMGSPRTRHSRSSSARRW